MPIIKSAKKRVKQTRKATIRNAKTKKILRMALKDFAKDAGGKNAAESHSKAQSALDIAVKKGMIHKNKAARKKRQLAAAAKAAGAPAPTKSAKATKKTGAKAPAKKTATKATAKKPAAKKSAK